MSGYCRPSMPAAVKVALRKEAGFGCARCGHPYIEYHHIVPFAEEEHFRPEDMVALCGNCHPAVAKKGRLYAYDLKGQPHNIREGLVQGALEYDKSDLIFKVGGNWYENTPILLQFQGVPIIGCRLNEGEAQVSLNLLDSSGKVLLAVRNNDITFRVNDLWDFEYKHNLAIARLGPRDVALKMDFRGPEATIEGKLWLGHNKIQLGGEQTILPENNVIRGSRISNCGIGISIG